MVRVVLLVSSWAWGHPSGSEQVYTRATQVRGIQIYKTYSKTYRGGKTPFFILNHLILNKKKLTL